MIIFIRIVIRLLASVRYLHPFSVSPRSKIATGFSAWSGWYIARSVPSPLASHWQRGLHIGLDSLRFLFFLRLLYRLLLAWWLR